MANDNVVANTNTSVGPTFRTLADGSGNQHPASVVEYATSISAGNNTLQPVTTANGLPVQPATGATFSVQGNASPTYGVPIGDGGGNGGTTNKAAVLAFHNADFQGLNTSTYGLMTGGVAQLISAIGELDRARETGLDNQPSIGIAAGSQQNAMAFSVTCTISSITSGASVPGTGYSLTVSSASGTTRGVAWSIKVGTTFLFDSGNASVAEPVQVISVSGTTVKVLPAYASSSNTWANSHSAGTVTLTGFVYNQQRDSTLTDGSSPAGVSAGAMYFWNSTLNSGTGGLEIERSAAGELDGASGSGTNIAAEYEWNGGGPAAYSTGYPSGLQFDRARNVQAKGLGAGSVTSTLAANSTSLTLASAPTTLQPGQQIVIDAAGTPEVNYVGSTYTVGSTTVPLQNATAVSHTGAFTVWWDQFAPLGPSTNGFTGTGVGIEEEAVYDPSTNKFYLVRAPTADAMAGANLEAINSAVFNGTNFDRHRSLSSAGDGLGVALATQPSSSYNYQASSANTNQTLTISGTASQITRLTYLLIGFGNGAAAAVSANTVYVTITDNGTQFMEFTIPSGSGSFNVPLPPGGLKSSGANQAIAITVSAAGSSVISYITAGKLVA